LGPLREVAVMRRYPAAAVVCLTLVGCATAAPNPQVVREFQATVPTCDNQQRCAVKWEAAQAWVVNHSAFNLQIATDVLIQTYNPPLNGGNSAFDRYRVVKEPLGGGQYRIVISVWCINVFTCVPDTWQAALDFNRYVGSIN